jgi:hypothetical protein
MKHSNKVLLLLALLPCNLNSNPEINALITKRDTYSNRAEFLLIELRKIDRYINQLQNAHHANQNERKMAKKPISPKAFCFPLRPKNVVNHNAEVIERNHISDEEERSFITLMNSYLSYCKRNYKDDQSSACAINEEIENLKFKLQLQCEMEKAIS